VNVLSENPVQISSINLSVGESSDRMLELEEGADPPDLMATIEATGSGIVNATIHHDSDEENADVALPLSFEVPAEPAGPKTVEVNLGPAVVTPGTNHTVSVEMHSGADTRTPEATAPLPVSVQINGFVTPGDCEEIIRNWRSLKAQKEAKKADCEALEKQLNKLKQDLAGKEAEKPVKEQDLADCNEMRDDLQGEIDDILESMNAFMPPDAMAQTYESGDDFPPGSQYAGSRRNGSSAGVGISFSNGNAALGAIDKYENATGRNFGEDMAKMRQNIKDIDNLDTKIANKEADLNNLNGEIDDLKNNQIPAKEQELADCKTACDNLETQIQNYADAHKECLEQLEKQRKAEAAIRDAERQGARTQGQANRTGNKANNADGIIDGRAGSPSQVADDKADVATAKSCKEQADSLISQGKSLTRQARAALREGDTETATDLSAQAKAKFDQAKAKLDEADEHIDDARSRALGRKRRDCPVECEGLAEITEQRFKVFTSLDDVSIVLFGFTPEKWASFDAAAREAIDGLDTVSEIQSRGGKFSPIAGTTVSDVGDVATAIYNAFANNLAGSVAGWNVWIKHSGHVVIKRTIRRCVNGCWELEKVEEIITDETCSESKMLPGTVQQQSGDIQAQIQAKLNRYRNTLRPKRAGPPVTTKEQPQ
jgi:predicted nuclease with TOPRIM domain